MASYHPLWPDWAGKPPREKKYETPPSTDGNRALAVRRGHVKSKNAKSLHTNHYSDAKGSCAVVVKHGSREYRMVVPAEFPRAKLTFAIIGGTDNPSFELALRIGEGEASHLGYTVDPPLNTLTARFCASPVMPEEIKNPFPREVIAFDATEEIEVGHKIQTVPHRRDGFYTFSGGLSNVQWREAKLDDLAAFKNDEDVKAWFETGNKPVTYVNFKTQMSRCFRLEAAQSIEDGLRVDGFKLTICWLMDCFQLLSLDPAATASSTSSGRVPNPRPFLPSTQWWQPQTGHWRRGKPLTSLCSCRN